MLSGTSTFVVAVPLRSRTVTLSVPPNGCDGDVLDAAHVGRAREPVEDAGARQQALDLDRLVVAVPDALSWSMPAPPSMRSMPSARPRVSEVVAVAQVDAVVALAAGDDVGVRAAEQRVGGVGAVEDVLAGAAVERERDLRADGALAA